MEQRVHLSQQLATVGFKIQLKFATVNVRGINKSLKRRAIFRQLHTSFLQETYSTKAQENIWSAEWGGKICFNHGGKHSKGVAILFDPKLTVSVEKEIKSDGGRIIILETNQFSFAIDSMANLCKRGAKGRKV